LNTEEREIHLRDYLRVIEKRRFTVITFFVVVFVVVLIGTLTSTPVYQATTKVLIEKRDMPVLMMNYGYNAYDPDFYETQYQLIRSVSVGRRVVEILQLDKNYDSYFGNDSGGIFGGIKALVASAFTSKIQPKQNQAQKDSEREARADMLGRMISAGIVVSPVKNSKIVDISYLSSNPQLAKAIADTVAAAYIEELLDLNMSSARHILQWMTKKAEEERTRLDNSEKALQEYTRSKNLVTVENKMTIIPQQISQLNSQLITAETKKTEMESLYNKVKEVTRNHDAAETISVIATDPTVQSLRQQILQAEQKVMELSQKFGKKHPTMIRANEDLGILKAKREQEIRRVIDSVKNEYELAKSNEANLRKMLGETKGEALNVNEKFIEYEMMNREVETNRQLYDALIKRIKEQNITEQVQSTNVAIIEKAELPGSPVKPRKALNVLLGLIVGIFGGVGMAFFVEYLDQTVKSPDEVETKFGMPVFGMVPFFAPKEKNVENIVLREPTSTFAENYKVIRTALLLSSPEKPPKRILVTSTGPEEGKTVTSVNLAAAIAQSEHRVLLIDADLRRPRIHKIFSLENNKGLSTCLAGVSDDDIIQKGPIRNLDIITSGPIPPNPSELLSSQRLQQMMAAFAEKYDIIICDSPPLLTVTDSLVLGRILDGTIVVARAGKTTYELLGKSMKLLGDLNARVLGVVINALDIKKSSYYDFRYHTYYYTSDDETKL